MIAMKQQSWQILFRKEMNVQNGVPFIVKSICRKNVVFSLWNPRYDWIKFELGQTRFSLKREEKASWPLRQCYFTSKGPIKIAAISKERVLCKQIAGSVFGSEMLFLFTVVAKKVPFLATSSVFLDFCLHFGSGHLPSCYLVRVCYF